MSWVKWIVNVAAAVSLCGGMSNGCNNLDECPGELTCPNGVCCPSGEPYECNGKCYSASSPCGTTYTTCTASGSSGSSTTCGLGSCASGVDCCDNTTCVPSGAFCCGNGGGGVCPSGYWCCPTGCCEGSPTGGANTGSCPASNPLPCSAGWCCPYGEGNRTDVCCNNNPESSGCTSNGECASAPSGGSSSTGGCGTTMGCCPATGCGTGWFNSCVELCFPTSDDCGQATQEAIAAGVSDSCSCRQCY